ncbi:MAG: hypothetical protein M1819_000310 [Sarea resinae]|nr:MAG: hypothetical protein M1819_000310 [Sarea resinae]
MVDALPTIKVTGSQAKDARSIEEGTPIPSPIDDEANDVRDTRAHSRTDSEGAGKQSSIAKSAPNKFLRNLSSRDANSPNQSLQPNSEESASQSAIDPLSQHILKRTHTENLIPAHLRQGVSEGGSASDTQQTGAVSSDVNPTSDLSRGESSGTVPKEKKKGVSFLSRFRANKKKESSEDNEDESEQGDSRIEGTEADVFCQPIDNISYHPRFPPPPKYIKIRSHNKKEKDFNRLFLAQGLHNGPASGHHGAPGEPLSPTESGGATWALEFSKDGRYIAAGGQDKIVRVWAVLSTPEEREEHEKEEDASTLDASERGVRLNAPVFKKKTIRNYEGHSSTVLDISWSKNNFLLSSSMDKTVRLWHVSRAECLCCFRHSDFVTAIQFHPRDDRFFLAGSLDSKLRLWSIPDKSVAFWNHVPDLITAVSFTPDGKTAIAGCLNGLCLFFETEGLKYHTQIHVRSSHGRNAKGSKITGIQAINHPPDDPNGEVKLLITSNDSRVRLYNLRDKAMEVKFRGNENTSSQIHASFSDDGHYVICGSEDRKVYIWTTGPAEADKKDKHPVEIFEAHSAITTAAVFAPTSTKRLLSNSGDPLYDLCNPPPVMLISRTESNPSSKAPTENGHSEVLKAPKHEEFTPTYIARSAHPDGNIIVTADYLGWIKVFRQDCAYQKRRHESWETGFGLTKKIGTGMLGRASSIATKNSGRSARTSVSLQQPSDRILSWRNSVSNGSLETNSKSNSHNNPRRRSASPRKSLNTASPKAANTPRKGSVVNNVSSPANNNSSTPSIRGDASADAKGTTSTTNNTPTGASTSTAVSPSRDSTPDPLMLQGEQSYLFWNKANWMDQAAVTSFRNADDSTTALNDGSRGDSQSRDPNLLGPPIVKKVSSVSALSSEESSSLEEDDTEGEQLACVRCGSVSFRARMTRQGQRLLCTKCGTPA